MKILVLTFMIIFHLCFNFATALYGDDWEEPTDPEACGLQRALDGVWYIDEEEDRPDRMRLMPKIDAYSFDANKNKCIKYNRGGLGTNNNSFYSEKSCLKFCRPWNLKRSEEESPLNPTDPAVCSLQTALDCAWIKSEETGEVSKMVLLPLVTRYSFDANKNDCKKFNRAFHGYNKNSFADKKACLKLCRAWNYERSKPDLDAYEEATEQMKY